MNTTLSYPVDMAEKLHAALQAVTSALSDRLNVSSVIRN